MELGCTNCTVSVVCEECRKVKLFSEESHAPSDEGESDTEECHDVDDNERTDDETDDEGNSTT